LQKKYHNDSIVVDATGPLAVLDEYHQNYMQGGVTVVAATVGYGSSDLGSLDATVKNLKSWIDKFKDDSKKLLHVTSIDDIFRAKKEGKLGIIFHFQGSTPFEGDLNNIELYYRLGLRMSQLCYNTVDLVGCGCTEIKDSGLTEFGEKVIGEMNRLGIVVDCAHTGYQTSLDAIETSKSPVIISHGNPKGVYNNRRNIEDDLIRAIAKNGGVIGFNGFPGLVSDKSKPILDDILDHAEYMAKLVGAEHICFGMDYYEYQAGIADDETAQFVYQYLIESGTWTAEEYAPPPWHYPQGIEMPEKLANLTIGLHNRGFSEEEIKGILGLNIIRVFKEIWK